MNLHGLHGRCHYFFAHWAAIKYFIVVYFPGSVQFVAGSFVEALHAESGMLFVVARSWCFQWLRLSTCTMQPCYCCHYLASSSAEQHGCQPVWFTVSIFRRMAAGSRASTFCTRKLVKFPPPKYSDWAPLLGTLVI